MPFDPIDLGSVANDGTGDPARTAFGKVNDGFVAAESRLDDLETADTALDGRLDTLEGQTLDARLDVIEADYPGRKTLTILVQDPAGTVDLTTGDGKAMIPIDATLNGKNLIACSARVTTVSSSGVPTIQLRRNRGGTDADMLTTPLTVDASERSSSTAAAAAVIDTGNDDAATDDFVWIDVDVAGTGVRGLSVTLTFG
jgi:hypothetical protein